MSDEAKNHEQANQQPPASDKPTAADPAKTHVAQTFKHASPLIACRFDPTGRFVFAGAQDGRVWRWQLEGEAKTELNGHKSWVRSLAFSPEGQTLVTAGYDGTLVWWPAAAEKPEPLRTVAAHQGWIRAVVTSPDGQLLASVGNDLLVKLWNVADGSLVAELPGHESHIYNVAFHPDGQQLVTGDLKGNFLHWELPTGKEVRRFAEAALHKYDNTFWADIGGARGLTFSRDGKQLAASGITNVSNAFAGVGNPIVVLFDWEAGKQKVQQLSKAKVRGTAWGVALHPENFTIAVSGGSGGFLLFWKPDQKDEFHSFKLPDTGRDLDLHADTIRIATAHYNGQLVISKMAAKA